MELFYVTLYKILFVSSFTSKLLIGLATLNGHAYAIIFSQKKLPEEEPQLYFVLFIYVDDPIEHKTISL